MNYSFWKLLRAQWSWNNDKFWVKSYFISVPLYALWWVLGITLSNGEPLALFDRIVVGIFCGAIHALFVILSYHLVKLIVLGASCWFCSYCAKEGNVSAQDSYVEMLTWRK